MPIIRYIPFPSTHWSQVKRAGLADAESSREALAELLQRYLPALRSYLCLVRRLKPEAADELLQAFVADKVLEQLLLSHAEPTRGRFRAFLLRSLSNFATDIYRRESSHPLPVPATPADSSPGPSTVIEAEWARILVQTVTEQMRRECERTSRGDLWAIFEKRILAEAYSTQPPVPYEQLAAELQLRSPAQAANLLVTAKRMYARLLRAAISEYEADSDAIDHEIATLREVLRRVPADRSHPA